MECGEREGDTIADRRSTEFTPALRPEAPGGSIVHPQQETLPNMNAFESLKESYGEIADIESALSLLAWDQATYMPRGGASGRGFVMGTLASLRHEKFLSETLDKITSEIHADKLDREQKYFFDEFQWNRARARKLPDDFVRDVARAHADSFNAWLEAKKTSNFKIYEPHLTKVVELSRRASDYFGFEDHPLDAHIVSHERDLSVARLKPMLTELREGTVTLLRRIMKSPNQPDMKFLDAKWDTQKQWDFSEGKPVEQQMLPLSLSYDHRVVNGADAARFMVKLSRILSDFFQLLVEC